MLFLDIETRNSWENGDSFKIDDMKVSYVGVINGDTDEELDFWEEDMEKLQELLESGMTIVHYNGFTFDMPVLANYMGESVMDLHQIDLMVAAYKKIGFRPKLDDLATATLGYGKSGKGSDAVDYWATGQLDELKKYCLQDVRVTMEVYKYGVDNGFIKYFDRNGFMKEAEIDWSLGEKLPEEKNEDELTLF
jgi:DEAD/DEAH box helicase domain-containing protein